MRFGAVVMSVLLFAAAAVQYNDPDPLRWIVIYSLGGIASALAAAGRCPEWLAGLAFAGFLVWALSMIPAVLLFRVESVTEMSKGLVVDEEAREGAGLLLGAAWCGALWWWVRTTTRRSGNDRPASEPSP